MPILLRTRPECHYCGKKNKPINDNRFQCQYCLAENFLDENGEIADVPLEIAAGPGQHAWGVETTQSDAESIFCSTCVRNQARYTEALSEFLPDLDDPEYDQYEAALPEFKKRMEEQYPQCCSRCEPKVRQQLQQASYNARTDHLRRVLQKSRAKRIADRLGWRSMLVFVAGFGYLSSILVQLLWHAFGSQSVSVIVPVRPSECFVRWPVSISCVNYVERRLWLSYVVGLACMWWNPGWQAKLQGQADRLKGLSSYYKAQSFLLSLRFAAWIFVHDIPQLTPYHRQLHSIFLVLILMIAGYARWGIVQVDNTPLVDWHFDPAPLVSSSQFEGSKHLASPPSSQEPDTLFENLGSVSAPQYQAWRPPTPPNDADAMDWAPSPSVFTPKPKQVRYKNTQPNPFHGVLPQLPRGNVFVARTQPIVQSKSMGIPIGFFDRSPTHAPKAKAAGMERTPLAQPKFFPKDDRSDTGLENIFGKVFSLHDKTLEVRNEARSIHSERGMLEEFAAHQPSTHLSVAQKTFNILAIVLLACFTVHDLSVRYRGTLILSQTRTILQLCLVVPFSNCCFAAKYKARTSQVAVLLLEFSFILGLVTAQPALESVLLPLWLKLVTGTILFLLTQEIYSLCVNQGDIVSQQSTPSKLPAFPVRSQAEQAESFPSSLSTGRRDSISSVATDSSVNTVNTTSTASGWKTPVANHRQEYISPGPRVTRSSHPSSSSSGSAFGMAGLGLNEFSVGGSVAGPRNQRSRY